MYIWCIKGPMGPKSFGKIFVKMYKDTKESDRISGNISTQRQVLSAFEHHISMVAIDSWELPRNKRTRDLFVANNTYTVDVSIQGVAYTYESKIFYDAYRYYYAGGFFVDGTRTSARRWISLALKGLS